jgi:hypothetical protein
MHSSKVRKRSMNPGVCLPLAIPFSSLLCWPSPPRADTSELPSLPLGAGPRRLCLQQLRQAALSEVVEPIQINTVLVRMVSVTHEMADVGLSIDLPILQNE